MDFEVERHAVAEIDVAAEGLRSITNLVANLSVAKVTSAVTGSDVEAVSTAAPTTGDAFRYDAASGQYVFNLSTKSLSKGTWRLSIDMHDGVTRTATISLK